MSPSSTPPAEEIIAAPREPMPRVYFVSLVLILLAAFLLRIVGIKHGLPYAYNLDESNYYVTRAIRMVNGSLNPQWFVNPPGFTYILAAGFKVLSGGGRGFTEVYARNPEPVWILARTISALLGTAAAGLLYAAGARLFDRRVGLFAAAVLSVGFLPVFYGHIAVNDSPLLVPLCLALYGAAGILKGGGRRYWAAAGIGLGLACSIKYTGGMVAIAILFAAWPRRGERTKIMLSVAGLGLITFLVTNPYAILDWAHFRADLGHQSEASSGPGKLGQTGSGGVLYYLGVMTWGLGWVPALFALAGAIRLATRDFAKARVLLLAPAAYLVFMGLHTRWFGRWGMPAVPFVCLLAGYSASELLTFVKERQPRVLIPAALALVFAVTAQGAVASIHLDQVLSRTDTRTLARQWMKSNIPKGARVVVEPGVVPDAWLRDLSLSTQGRLRKRRWQVWTMRDWGITSPDQYPRVLNPKLAQRYSQQGWCWLVTSSTQRGRVERDPAAAPDAIRFYQRLFSQGHLIFRVKPWTPDATPVPFSFDDSFNYRPSQYMRPGPVISIYWLRGGRCGAK